MLEVVKTLSSSEEIKAQVPLRESLKAIKLNRDAQMKAILDGSDNRKALIIGP